MNLCFGQFVDTYLPAVDGVIQTVRNYAFWLQKKHGDAYVVAPEAPGYQDTEDFPVARFRSIGIPKFPPYRMGIPLFDLEFHKEMGAAPFTLTHAHSPFIAGYLALRIGRNRGIPVVATFHSKYREDIARALKSQLITEASVKLIVAYYNYVDEVWVPSRSTGKTLEEYGYRGSYEVMPNGSDLEIPSPETYLSLRESGRKAAGVSGNPPLFRFVGRHRWEKNVKLIIYSLKLLKDAGRDFRMLFVGQGYAEEDMKKLVLEQGLSDRVTFRGVVLDREILKEIYAAADVFLFPSLYDNVPLVVREAAAFRVPSVLVRGSTAAEGFQDNVNGFLVEDDPRDMAQKLFTLMDIPELVKSAGEGAQSTIFISWEKIIDSVFERYRKIIAMYKKPRDLKPNIISDSFFVHFWRQRMDDDKQDR